MVFKKEDWSNEWRKKLLRECHKLRLDYGNLQIITDEELILSALKMYKRKRGKLLKNRKLKNGN